MMEGDEESISPCLISSLMVKFRKLFPDKSMDALTNYYIQIIDSINFRTSQSSKSNSNSNQKSLDLSDFKTAILKHYKGKFDFNEIKGIFTFLDTNRNGRVEVEEFVYGIRGILNEYRQRIVNFIFHRLDKNGSGYIEELELKNFIQSSFLPDIVSGLCSAEDMCYEFMEKNGFIGKISPLELTNYYLNKSVEISSDTKFKADCMDEWHLCDEEANKFITSQTILSIKSRAQGHGHGLGLVMGQSPGQGPDHVTNNTPISSNSSELSLNNSIYSPSKNQESNRFHGKDPTITEKSVKEALIRRFDSCDSIASADFRLNNAPRAPTNADSTGNGTENEDEEGEGDDYEDCMRFEEDPYADDVRRSQRNVHSNLYTSTSTTTGQSSQSYGTATTTRNGTRSGTGTSTPAVLKPNEAKKVQDSPPKNSCRRYVTGSPLSSSPVRNQIQSPSHNSQMQSFSQYSNKNSSQTTRQNTNQNSNLNSTYNSTQNLNQNLDQNSPPNFCEYQYVGEKFHINSFGKIDAEKILDLNSQIFSLRMKIDKQNIVINTQERIIDKRHDMIKNMQRSLGSLLS